jgi:hypothetical protein
MDRGRALALVILLAVVGCAPLGNVPAPAPYSQHDGGAGPRGGEGGGGEGGGGEGGGMM